MTPAIEPPLLGKSERDAKHLVIAVLSRSPGLSAKEIFKAIREDAGNTLTYQAVHKAVRQLSELGTLVKTGKVYSINSAWAAQLKAFGEQLEAKFKNQVVSLVDLQPNSSISIPFAASYMEPYYWTLWEMLKVVYSTPDPVFYAAYMSRAWPVFAIGERERLGIQKIFAKEGKHYVICGSKQFADKLLLDMWLSMGLTKYLAGAKCDYISDNVDTLVFGDYVIQLCYDKTIKTKLDASYEYLNKKPAQMAEVYTLLFNTPAKTTLIVTRNAELAKRYEQDTLQHFKK